MKELKIGLIGCGGMAKNYREIYTKIKGARLDFVVGLTRTIRARLHKCLAHRAIRQTMRI